MWNGFKKIILCVGLLLTTVAPLPAGAAPKTIEQFTQQTWQQFQTGLARPSVVIFSTTDCAHCPAVIEKMASEIKLRKLKAPLIVVLMDEEVDPAHLQDAYYRKVNRLLAFSGSTPALQHAINPKWRGVTPYVALFPPAGEPRFVTGSPSVNDISAWLAAAGSKSQ